MKKAYMAAQAERNGKFYAFVVAVASGQNIKTLVDRTKGAKSFMLCDSKKAAVDLVSRWNLGFKQEGVLWLD